MTQILLWIALFIFTAGIMGWVLHDAHQLEKQTMSFIIGDSLVDNTAEGGATPAALRAQIIATQNSQARGYWECDDTGTLLDDSRTTNFDLAQTGSSGWSYSNAGQVGNAVGGSGSGGWLDSIGTGVLPSSNGFTLMCLMRASAGADKTPIMGVGHATIVSRSVQLVGSSNANGLELGVIANATGAVNVAIDVDTQVLGAVDTWYHVVLRGLLSSQGAVGGAGGPDDIDLIVNNVKTTVANTTMQGGQHNQGTVLAGSVGGDIGTYWSSGLIQHVAFWNIALTDAEITSIFNETGL